LSDLLACAAGLGCSPNRISSALADWADKARFEIHEDRALQMGAVRDELPVVILDLTGRNALDSSRSTAMNPKAGMGAPNCAFRPGENSPKPVLADRFRSRGLRVTSQFHLGCNTGCKHQTFYGPKTCYVLGRCLPVMAEHGSAELSAVL